MLWEWSRHTLTRLAKAIGCEPENMSREDGSLRSAVGLDSKRTKRLLQHLHFLGKKIYYRQTAGFSFVDDVPRRPSKTKGSTE